MQKDHQAINSGPISSVNETSLALVHKSDEKKAETTRHLLHAMQTILGALDEVKTLLKDGAALKAIEGHTDHNKPLGRGGEQQMIGQGGTQQAHPIVHEVASAKAHVKTLETEIAAAKKAIHAKKEIAIAKAAGPELKQIAKLEGHLKVLEKAVDAAKAALGDKVKEKVAEKILPSVLKAKAVLTLAEQTLNLIHKAVHMVEVKGEEKLVEEIKVNLESIKWDLETLKGDYEWYNSLSPEYQDFYAASYEAMEEDLRADARQTILQTEVQVDALKMANHHIQS